MSEKPKSLPHRRYYSLPDAVKHLNDEGLKCTIGDLFHFGATGAFEPMVYFNSFWNFTYITDSLQRGIYDIETESENEPSKLALTARNISDEYLYESDLCYLHLANCENDEDEDEDEDEDDNNGTRLFGDDVVIQGFLGFRPLDEHRFFYALERTGSVPIEQAIFSPPFTGIIEQHINPNCLPYMTFFNRMLKIEDIFISEYEMEILKRGGRRNAGEDIFNEFSSTRHRPERTLSQINEDDPRNKWPEFIRNLLCLYYDSDTAQAPWKHMAEIEKDFQGKGLTPPSEKSLRRWLKKR